MPNGGLKFRPIRLRLSGARSDAGHPGRAAKKVGATAGASIPSGDGQALLRAVYRPSPRTTGAAAHPRPRGQLGSATATDHRRLGRVEGLSPRLGAATQDGQGKVEIGHLMAQMLRGENALDDAAVGSHAADGRNPQSLPRCGAARCLRSQRAGPAQRCAPSGKTCWAASWVALVLLLTLGGWRAGLLVALVIPAFDALGGRGGDGASGVPNQLERAWVRLTSGLLVDGAVVMVEHPVSPSIGPARR